MDQRSGLSKLHKTIGYLRNFYKDGDRIPIEDVKLAIYEVIGCDKRTVKKYLTLSVDLSFLTPASKSISNVKSTVTVRNPETGKIHAKEYSSRLGFQAYRFGLRSPKNVKFPPSPLQKILNIECFDRMRVRVSDEPGHNISGILDGSFSRDETFCTSDSIKDGLGRKEKRKEKILSHTHIHNDIILKKSKQTKEEQRLFSLYDNLTKIGSHPTSKGHVCLSSSVTIRNTDATDLSTSFYIISRS